MPAVSSNAALNPQIETLIREFQQASTEAHALLAATPQESLRKRPSPGSWSALECIEHLTLSSKAMLPRIQQAIDAARQAPRLQKTPFRSDLLGRILAWSLEPPSRMRVKTSAFAEPVECGTPHDVMERFERQQQNLIDMLRASAGLPIDQEKVKSPFGNMSYNAYSAFRIIAAHNRRHLWQADKALKKVG